MRILLLSLMFSVMFLSACTGSTPDAREVRSFAEAIHGAECPTAECAAENDDEEEFLAIVTN